MIENKSNNGSEPTKSTEGDRDKLEELISQIKTTLNKLIDYELNSLELDEYYESRKDILTNTRILQDTIIWFVNLFGANVSKPKINPPGWVFESLNRYQELLLKAKPLAQKTGLDLMSVIAEMINFKIDSRKTDYDSRRKEE